MALISSLCSSYSSDFADSPLVQTNSVVGVLQDDVDPLVSVMKLEKAPKETYADIGGLDIQIQEMKVCLPSFDTTSRKWSYVSLFLGSR